MSVWMDTEHQDRSHRATHPDQCQTDDGCLDLSITFMREYCGRTLLAIHDL